MSALRWNVLAVVKRAGGDEHHAYERYCTLPSDSPANTLFSGRLREIEIEEGVTFTPWSGTRGGGPALSKVEFWNTDGALDGWIADDWEDVRVELYVLQQRQAFSAATLVAALTVSTLELPAQNVVALIAKDWLEVLDGVITRTYPETHPVEALREQTMPLCLGRVRWTAPVYSRPREAPIAGEYDVTDDIYHSIHEMSHGGQAWELTPDTVTNAAASYAQANRSDRHGVRLMQDTDKRVAIECTGNVRRDAQLLTHSTFATGAPLGNPDGWTVTAGGGGTVAWLNPGQVEIGSNGAAAAIEQSLTGLTVGAEYQIDVDVLWCASGVLAVLAGGAECGRIGLVVNTASAYTFRFVFTAASTSAAIRVQNADGAACLATLSAVRCQRVYRIDTLPEVMRFIASRLNLSLSAFDLVGAAAVQSDASRRLAWYTTSETTGAELLRAAASSLSAGMYLSPLGVLTAVQFGVPGGAAEIHIRERDIDGGLIRVRFDDAKGLSARAAYAINYSPHSEEDTALTPLEARKAELQREYRTVRTTRVIPARYKDAEDREPIRLLVSDEATAQAMIDGLWDAYLSASRFAFLTLRFRLRAGLQPYQVKPGMKVRLTHRRYGLATGKDFVVAYARRPLIGRAATVTLWGAL